jgi:hypothetical protein
MLHTQLAKHKWLVYAMTHDLILGNGVVRGGGSCKKILLKYKSPMIAALVRMKVR